MRLSFLIILSILCVTSYAQQKITTQHIGWRGGPVELHSISNKEQACTFILNNDSVKAFLINGSTPAVELFTVRRKMYELFMGGFIKNGNIYLFLNNGKQAGIHSWLYSINDKKITENVVPFEIKNEKIINRLSSPGHYFYFTVNKKTSEFIIYKFVDETRYERLVYAVEQGIWDDISERERALSSAKINIEKTDMEGECDIEIAQSPSKLYVRNDSLLLILNNKKGITAIYTFDLLSNNLTKRVIKHKYDSEDKSSMVFNSFLLRNKLYYAAATEDGLSLQVIDFFSGEVLKEFTAKSDEEINFKNTAITQEGSLLLPGTIRELGKTKQLLRKMTNDRLVITATPNDSSNTTVITLGSYKKVQEYSGGGMFLPGVGAGAPMIFIPTGGFTRNSWTKSARFQSIISNASNDHVDGEITPLINDKIEEYTKDIKIPSEGENLFVLNEKYYYVFYNKQERDFIVTQF